MYTIRRRYGIALLIITASLLSGREMYEAATDTINTSQTFIDNGDTIVSAGESFELGFFSPENSNNRYVGIWYKRVVTVRTVVWVANTETPLTDTSGSMRLVEPGILVLLNNNTNATVWSTNVSRTVQNPIARLLDSGNLVVKDADEDNPEVFLWQSFDHPTDTLLPGMKIGRNFVTNVEVHISSRKSNTDLATGEYTFTCDPTGYPQDIVRKGEIVIYRTGPWNGIGFSGNPNLRKNSIYTYGVVINEHEVYYHYELLNNSVISRFTLNKNGVCERLIWVDGTQDWHVYLTAPTDNCDLYKNCGPYGSCNIENSPVCGCLKKFKPKDPQGWERGDWSNGCVRSTSLNCAKGDGFLKYSGVKLPDTRLSWYNESMNLDECKLMCSKNCSCMAYTSLDISKGGIGNGCLLWYGDLVDIKELSPGQDIHIRMASSELDSEESKRAILAVTLALVIGIVLLSLSLVLYCLKRRKLDLQLQETGLLEDGQEVAVKRLSRTSLQGVHEFKNEVNCIAKLQHRNLVKLLGCCIDGEEKLLVYEYMTNKSLDLILFDPRKSMLLDWPRRFNIINGIARGLMYLHQDSRLRVIHRDLKASNILLDSDMNPKISDFGLARTFGGNETGANTSRVVGTYGYMSPEYAIDGVFSVKSDVFSYGVLVLEIVSGKRNRGFSHRDHRLNLLGHAWMLHREERSLELVDSYLINSGYLREVLRSIEVGLLCVQECPEDRPNMSTVVFMLSNECVLPEAKHPGFFTGRDTSKIETSTSSNTATSSNEMSFTMLDGR
ncbi:hypothetical protein ABFX02_08G179900 [Erythranthe guttata]